MHAHRVYTIDRDLVRTGFLRAQDNNVVSSDEVEASSLVARLIARGHEAEARRLGALRWRSRRLRAISKRKLSFHLFWRSGLLLAACTVFFAAREGMNANDFSGGVLPLHHGRLEWSRHASSLRESCIAWMSLT